MSTNYETRIILIGETGSGKSATGNSILGIPNAFESRVSCTSETKTCSYAHNYQLDRMICVVDTPGLYDARMKSEGVLTEINRCVGLSTPGPHAIIFVTSAVRRYTDEERRTLQHFVDHFGEGMYRYLIVLFTGGDDLEYNETTLSEYIRISPQSLKKILHLADNRYLAFNNRLAFGSADMEMQVQNLLSMITSNVNANRGSYYTNHLYSQAEVKLREEEERKRLDNQAKQDGSDRIKDQFIDMKLQPASLERSLKEGLDVLKARVVSEYQEPSAVEEEWISNYYKVERLGHGKFGEVFEYKLKEGKRSDLPNTMAVKVLPNLSKKNASQKEMKEKQMLKREIVILMGLAHNNLIHLYKVTEDVFHYYLIMELCECNLKQFLEKQSTVRKDDDITSRFEIDVVVSFGSQIMDAFIYLHQKSIIHRDMKSENVLLKHSEPKNNPSKITLKVCDFGLSRFMPIDSSMMTICGTRKYMAPEVAMAEMQSLNRGNITLKADIFSIGVVLYEISTNYLTPFDLTNMSEDTWDLAFISNFIKNDNLSNLLRKMLAWKPTNRPSAEAVRNDIFFESLKIKVSDESNYSSTPQPIKKA